MLSTTLMNSVMTFEEFWKEYEESSDLLSLEGAARWAWEEAVLAERERCLKICKDYQRCWDLDDSIPPEEIAYAIRGESK